VNQNVVRSTFTVFVFWWIILAVYAIGWEDTDWSYAWRSTTSLAFLTVLGIVLGVGCVWFYIWSDRYTQRALLKGEAVRGLICTLGELPILAKEPPQSVELPDLSSVPDVPPDFFPSWFDRFEKTHPAHVELMRAFLRIYEHRKALPATHIAGGHGGRSLLQHSLLVAYFMDKLANTWTYTGLRDRSGKRVVLKLRDQAYKFVADDPLVALIGIAHDIGKIEAYIFDKDSPSEIVGIHHEHDLTGARMIARLPEAWGIPDIDRQAMFLSIAHYHHPMELPLSPDRRAIDDRTIALMELLIKADFVTSRVEAKGVEPTEAEYEQAGETPTHTETSSESLWTAFTEIITEHGRINSPDPRFNVATLCLGKGFTKPMLMMKEDSIRSALVKRLSLQSATLLGDGRYQLTIDLLKVLADKGILHRTHDGVEYSPENALWNVDFMTRAAVGAEPEKKSGWSAVIIVDPKVFTRIEQMEPYWWFAVIQRGTMGAARAINKKAIAPKRKKQTLNLLEASDDEIDAQFAAVSSSLNPVPMATSIETPVPTLANDVSQEVEPQETAAQPLQPLLLSAPWEEEGVANVEPAETAQESNAVSVAAHEEPKRNIAPIDVKQALCRAITVAQERGVELRQLNDRYLVSSQSLSVLVPEIEWDACRYKIEQMVKSSKLEAMYVPMGEEGAYALVFSKDLA
jgi:hypothetical protein